MHFGEANNIEVENSLDSTSKVAENIVFKSPINVDPKIFHMGKCFSPLPNDYFLMKISPTQVGLFDATGGFVKFITAGGEGKEGFPAVIWVSSFENGFIVSDGVLSKRAYVYNLDGELEQTTLFPILSMLVVSVEKYGNFLFIGGFGYKFQLDDKKVKQIILFAKLNYEDYSVDILLTRNAKESNSIVRNMDASPVDNFYFTINRNTGKIAGLCSLQPYLWIFDAVSGKVVRKYKFVPKHYKEIILRSLYGDDFDSWLSEWSYSNIPFWLTDRIVIVNRSLKGKNFVDLYNIDNPADTAKTYITDSEFPVIYATNGLIYLISKVEEKNITIQIRELTTG